jgi:YD repeat-containing protein
MKLPKGTLLALAAIAAAARAGETVQYTYDAKGQLVRVDRTGSVNNGNTAVIQYDAAGNRTAYQSSRILFRQSFESGIPAFTHKSDGGMVYPATVAPVRLTQRRAQAIGTLRHEDQVDVIVHQAPGEAAHVRRGAALAHQLQIQAPVLIREEHRLPAIAALGDVVSDAGDDDAGEAGHSGDVAIGVTDGYLVLPPETPVSPELLGVTGTSCQERALDLIKYLENSSDSIGKFYLFGAHDNYRAAIASVLKPRLVRHLRFWISGSLSRN